MIFHETGFYGCYLIEPEPREDERGFFARTFDAAEFRKKGLSAIIAECSISYNRSPLTLRGLHYQVSPNEEAKLVRCLRGRVYDVAVDLRLESATYRKWLAFDLNDKNKLSVYMPERFAHGFLTLTPDVEMSYQMSATFEPGTASGIRWDDPELGIRWPDRPAVISTRDKIWPSISARRLS